MKKKELIAKLEKEIAEKQASYNKCEIEKNQAEHDKDNWKRECVLREMNMYLFMKLGMEIAKSYVELLEEDN